MTLVLDASAMVEFILGRRKVLGYKHLCSDMAAIYTRPTSFWPNP